MIYTVIILFVIFLIMFASMCFLVQQQSIAIIECFGKFNRHCMPGLNFKIPIIERIAGRVNLRVQQLDIPVETKTKDNVFVKVVVSVQSEL